MNINVHRIVGMYHFVQRCLVVVVMRSDAILTFASRIQARAARGG